MLARSRRVILSTLMLGVLGGAGLAAGFGHDRAAGPGARPWRLENLLNNPENFQFVVIGNRTGGANALDAFKLVAQQVRRVVSSARAGRG